MYVSADLIWLAVALPLAGFLINGALAIWRPGAKTAVSVVGPAVLIGAFAVVALIFRSYAAANIATAQVVSLWTWLPVGSLTVDLSLLVDRLSLVMLLVVTGVGSLIHLFSVGYMRSDPGYARYFAYLNLFVVFMLVLVLGASLPVLFIGWEGVGLCSYLLIGFWYGDKANADAGKKAFLVNRIGDFGFMVAMFLIWVTLGTPRTSWRSANWRRSSLAVGGGLVTAITLFLFLGCTGKSAQIPLYIWLPDAMAGPTPVSALIHAATMVTAGVYLVARTNVLFAMAPLSSTVVAGIGALTALFAATIGLRQYDIKKVLAYSTVSQLGYMFLAVGTGAYVGRHLPPGHARLLQGAPLPWRRQRDPLRCTTPIMRRTPTRMRRTCGTWAGSGAPCRGPLRSWASRRWRSRASHRSPGSSPRTRPSPRPSRAGRKYPRSGSSGFSA